MEIASRQNPDISVFNNSGLQVTGWLTRQGVQPRIELFNLMPKQTTKPNYIDRTKASGLALIHAHQDVYHLFCRNGNLEFYIQEPLTPAQRTTGVPTLSLLQQIPIAFVKQFAMVTIKENGKATLFTPGYKPQDGRPDVNLKAYKDLTGYEGYVTPECILGVHLGCSKSDIQTTYKTFLSNWNDIHSRLQNADDVFKLVLWAKRRLEEQLS